MSLRFSKISTIVRTYLLLAALRAGFRLQSWFAPGTAVRRAGRLFCLPHPSGRRRAMIAPTHDALEEDLVIDGVNIHVYRWGDPSQQPYVLFAHGWSSHGTRVANWIAPLRAAGYAVVTFDQAAHGRSEGTQTNLPEFACHLLAIASRHGPAEAVIGHSLGGAAAAVALAHGLQARRAVLIAPPADPLVMAEQFARMVGLARHLSRRMFAMFERSMRFTVEELQAQNFAPTIAQPALIVHDLEDREVPWSEGERYARYWANSRLVSTRGLGHHRIADDQNTIAASLRFLRGEAVGERVVSSPNLPYGFA